MFPSRYFAARYFAPRYWAEVGGEPVPIVPVTGTGTPIWPGQGFPWPGTGPVGGFF